MLMFGEDNLKRTCIQARWCAGIKLIHGMCVWIESVAIMNAAFVHVYSAASLFSRLLAVVM